MLKKFGITIVVLALFVSLTIASASAASEDSIKKTGNGGYYVIPAKDNSIMDSMASSIYYITQGQINWHDKYISGGPGFNVDLNWGSSANSLRLRIFTPDGYVLGPFYDYTDGMIDGRINIYIGRDGGVAPGTYHSEVYGERVLGIEDYTFT